MSANRPSLSQVPGSAVLDPPPFEAGLRHAAAAEGPAASYNGVAMRQTVALTLVAAVVALASAVAARAQTTPVPLPRLVENDGRHALLVDGAPFLILGLQAHNSSAWPAMLPKVWPAVEAMHANTLEVPVYWEQFEPEPGRFDTLVVDTLIHEARAHGVRLVLLWFGTWKNGSSHYLPLWMKRDPDRFPRMVDADGRRVDSPSPHAKATLEADVRAFSAFMRHLKTVDAERTVIMVQVQNEPGTWGGLVRDHSPEAERLFAQAAPAELIAKLGVKAAPGATWSAAFGRDADEYFHAWSIARFIEQVAAAGKKEYPLPMYVNAALRDPIQPGPAGSYETGGATDNVIPVWKAAAPSIDLLAPDIYMDDSVRYLKVLEQYGRHDNALFVPENGHAPWYAHMFFAALGHQAIGWAPFGLDYTAWAKAPIGAPLVDEETLAPFALNYRLVGPMMREVARLGFEGKVQAVSEARGEPTQTLDLGAWTATVSYGVPAFGFGHDPPGNPEPIGRALIATLGENQFLVTGAFCRVDFRSTDPSKQREFVRVEEGGFEDGVFQPIRIWNGDETDWGLNFASGPQIVRATLGTY
jgi:beta-galactosidase GanA